MTNNSVDVAVVMGSISDWDQMKYVCEILEVLNISYDKQVISAHRMPSEMLAFAEGAQDAGYKVIIAGAGGAAHLPGMIASKTTLPVVGVPIKSSTLNGIDSLLSIVQMPAGVPVATMAIGPAGARNAALMAGRILALGNPVIEAALLAFRQEQRRQSIESSERLND